MLPAPGALLRSLVAALLLLVAQWDAVGCHVVGMGQKGAWTMTLRRYIPVRDGLEDAGLRMVCLDDGAWVRAADVLALLARIREAVEVERGAVEQSCIAKDVPGVLPSEECGCDACEDWLDARAALGELLAVETIHQCPPDGQRITPCCGRIPFDLIGDRMATDPKLVTCRGRTS